MKIYSLLQKNIPLLQERGLKKEEAENEIRLILAHLLKIPPLKVYFYEGELPEDTVKRFQDILENRLKGIPLAYLLGETEFFGYRFFISSGALIPRPETEILVEAVLETLTCRPAHLCELGVGSGVISLTLALECPDFRLFGVELSPAALEVACKNRRYWHLEERVLFIRGNWLEPFKKGPFFEAIVSNPPYIAPEEWPELPSEVRDYEPKEALLAEENGLAFIRRTLEQAPDYLCPGGYVFLEIGYNQATLVSSLAKELGYQISFKRDFLGFKRVLVAKK